MNSFYLPGQKENVIKYQGGQKDRVPGLQSVVLLIVNVMWGNNDLLSKMKHLNVLPADCVLVWREHTPSRVKGRSFFLIPYILFTKIKPSAKHKYTHPAIIYHYMPQWGHVGVGACPSCPGARGGVHPQQQFIHIHTNFTWTRIFLLITI